MSSKVISRQLTILKFLEKGTKTNIELTSYLKSKGHSYSTSTLSKDIKDLKESGFKIEDSKKGYYSLYLGGCNELYSHFVKYQSMAITYQKALNISEKDMTYILFEPNALEFNMDIFNIILNAIKNRKQVVFKYIVFQNNNEIKEYKLKPFLLKEFQNRWYVMGETSNGYRTFSLDRISDLTETTVKYTIDLELIEEQLNHSVGVSFDENVIKPKHTKLRIANSQKEYIKTTPILKTQKITEENNTHFILEMFVSDTVELRQQILKYGTRIEVVEPESLRNKIKEEVKSMLELYK